MKRRVTPSVVGLEARAYLSAVDVAAVTPPAAAPNQFLDPTGQPTRHELRRQAVRFAFEGAFLQGPGRFTDTASQVLIKGVGASTFFLHGDVQLGAYVPTDPTRPTSGSATSQDRNVNTNSVFGVALTGSPSDVDRAGRPTRFTFTVDKNLSAGTFGQATGTGTVTIRYSPKGAHRAGAMSEGRATVLITGDVYTLGSSPAFGVLGSTNSLDPRKVRI